MLFSSFHKLIYVCFFRNGENIYSGRNHEFEFSILEPTPSKPSLFPAFTVTVLLNFHIKKHCFLLKI